VCSNHDISARPACEIADYSRFYVNSLLLILHLSMKLKENDFWLKSIFVNLSKKSDIGSIQDLVI
jgi:hypothetical protein